MWRCQAFGFVDSGCSLEYNSTGADPVPRPQTINQSPNLEPDSRHWHKSHSQTKIHATDPDHKPIPRPRSTTLSCTMQCFPLVFSYSSTTLSWKISVVHDSVMKRGAVFTTVSWNLARFSRQCHEKGPHFHDSVTKRGAAFTTLSSNLEPFSRQCHQNVARCSDTGIAKCRIFINCCTSGYLRGGPKSPPQTWLLRNPTCGGRR